MIKYYGKNNDKEKFCPKCKKTLNRSKFSKNKSRHDGCAPYCKKCVNLISIERGIVRPFKCIKNSNSLKWCSKCNKIKEHFDFRINENRIDGLNDWCKSCCNNHQKIERRKGPIKREIIYRNSKKGKLTQKKAQKKYRKTNNYKENKLARNISNHIKYSLKTGKQGNSWKDLVTWDINDLKSHIEKLFKQGMNWENHGEWHIDHIKPICSFNITDYKCEDFKNCWSLNNLQPLWKYDNQSKGSKYKGVDYRYE